MSGSHFDPIAAAYDESLPAHVVEHYLRKRTRFMRRALPARAGLDVGCGTGRLAARLAAAGFAMTGRRSRPRGCSTSCARAARRSTPSRRRAPALPFPDGTFDLDLCVAVIHHVADPPPCAATLGEMARVTRPAGHVLVWDHNPRNPYWPLLMARVPQDTGDERLIGERERRRAARARAPRSCARRSSAGCPTSCRRGRSPRPRRPSGRSSGCRWCAGWALTTSSSPPGRRSPDRWYDRARHGAVQAQGEAGRRGAGRARAQARPL